MLVYKLSDEDTRSYKVQQLEALKLNTSDFTNLHEILSSSYVTAERPQSEDNYQL